MSIAARLEKLEQQHNSEDWPGLAEQQAKKQAAFEAMLPQLIADIEAFYAERRAAGIIEVACAYLEAQRVKR